MKLDLNIKIELKSIRFMFDDRGPTTAEIKFVQLQTGNPRGVGEEVSKLEIPVTQTMNSELKHLINTHVGEVLNKNVL